MDRKQQINKETLFYLLLLIGYQAHLFEEITGGFFVIEKSGGLGNFLIINWLTFSFFIFVFYFILKRKRWAYIVGLILAVGMTVNGLVHNIAAVVNFSFLGEVAGEYSGIALLIIGPVSAYYLLKGMPSNG